MLLFVDSLVCYCLVICYCCSLFFLFLLFVALGWFGLCWLALGLVRLSRVGLDRFVVVCCC